MFQACLNYIHIFYNKCTRVTNLVLEPPLYNATDSNWYYKGQKFIWKNATHLLKYYEISVTTIFDSPVLMVL